MDPILIASCRNYIIGEFLGLKSGKLDLFLLTWFKRHIAATAKPHEHCRLWNVWEPSHLCFLLWFSSFSRYYLFIL